MTNDKIKVVALFGKTGSGKSYMVDKIISASGDMFAKVIMATTRPRRENETSNDYYFVNNEYVKMQVDKHPDDIVTCETFNSWIYLTTMKSFDKSKVNIGVFTISGIKKLMADGRFEVYPIYIRANDEVRMRRLIERDSDYTEVCRRYLSDNEVFAKYATKELMAHVWANNDSDKPFNLRIFCEVTGLTKFLDIKTHYYIVLYFHSISTFNYMMSKEEAPLFKKRIFPVTFDSKEEAEIIASAIDKTFYPVKHEIIKLSDLDNIN